MIAKGTGNYLISQSSEAEILFNSRLSAVVQLATGTGLILLGLVSSLLGLRLAGLTF